MKNSTSANKPTFGQGLKCNKEKKPVSQKSTFENSSFSGYYLTHSMKKKGGESFHLCFPLKKTANAWRLISKEEIKPHNFTEE